jgi:hypothetical protein
MCLCQFPDQVGLEHQLNQCRGGRVQGLCPEFSSRVLNEVMKWLKCSHGVDRQSWGDGFYNMKPGHFDMGFELINYAVLPIKDD